MTEYFIGVDVGTGSVRAGLVDCNGRVLKISTENLNIWKPKPEFYEQSSENIWNQCCKVVKNVIKDVDPMRVKGIGFDATCSLVVLDRNCRPLSVSPSGNANQNIIMWMDHRAKEQAARINRTKNDVLKNCGGNISLEMETPKLMWLKENLRQECWEKAGHFMELNDFLTWKATGSLVRSLCPLVCKWTYQHNSGESDKNGWCQKYFQEIGLGDLLSDNRSKIGNNPLSPGERCGSGLSNEAAKEFGLNQGTSVGVGIVDAHCGVLGCIGCNPNDNQEIENIPLESRMIMICGTSTCHISLPEKAIYPKGIWGPYYSVILPGRWCMEAGQSACGKLIDHVIEKHPAYDELKCLATKSGRHPHEELNEILVSSAEKQKCPHPSFLTADYHVWPDYHGNRSPYSDPDIKGMICGLTLSTSVEDLAIQYLATVQALAYETKLILEVLKDSGQEVKMITACGGLSKNQLYIQMHADITGIPIVIPNEPESVLLGGAMMGAYASGTYSSLEEAIRKMSGKGVLKTPSKDTKTFHDKKYQVFKKMIEHQREYKDIMK